jgi:hypothetical protein
MIKYYCRLDSLKGYIPIALFYIDYSDFSEKHWNMKLKKWDEYDGLYYKIISGDMDYEQCSLEMAKQFVPEAFKKAEKDGK